MPFVLVHVYLNGSDAPPLMYSFSILQQVIHRCVWLDVDNALTDGTAALADTFHSFLVGIFHVLLLHGSTSLFLDQCFEIVVVLLKVDAHHVRCDIGLIVAGQFGAYI